MVGWNSTEQDWEAVESRFVLDMLKMLLRYPWKCRGGVDGEADVLGQTGWKLVMSTEEPR